MSRIGFGAAWLRRTAFLLAGCSNRYDLMGRIPGVVDVEHYARGHLGSVRTELVDQRRLQPYQHAPQYSVADAMSSLAWLALAPRSCVGLTSLPTGRKSTRLNSSH